MTLLMMRMAGNIIIFTTMMKLVMDTYYGDDDYHEDFDNDDSDGDDDHDGDDDFRFSHRRSGLHDGPDVVGHAEVCFLPFNEMDFVGNILHVHFDCFVSVPTLLFMPQTKGVSNLMNRVPELYKTTSSTHMLKH